MLCGKLVRTIELVNRPCLCDAGHADGCNPFSANPFMLPTLPGKAAPGGAGAPAAQPARADANAAPAVKSQCLWQGARGKCTLDAGHFPGTAHREDADPLIK